MSDVSPAPDHLVTDHPELARPGPPRSWRDHLAAWADTLDLSPRRLLAGVGVLVVAAFAAWRLLAPPAAPPEVDLPFAAPAAAPAGADDPSPATDPADGAGQPDGVAAGASPGGSAVPGEVVVHVAGAVASPGVQRLAAGARVVDAVEAAGGASPDADLGRVNLAATVGDGQQVYVPRVGEAPPALPAGPGTQGSGPGPGGGPASRVDLNRATVDELDTLPGIGPATAAAIIAHREQHGPFGSVDELIDVRGIGEAKLEQLRDLVTV